MIAIYDQTTDVSTTLKEGSLRLTDQMGNRKNTASFSLINQKVDQGRSIYIYETLTLRKDSSSGTDTLFVDDVYSDTQKWRAGDIIIVDLKGPDERKYEIDSVDDTNREVILTENLMITVSKATVKVGRLLFGGIVQNNPDEEIGVTGTFEYKVRCVDWTNLYDRKLVVQQYQTMYPREVLGRIIYTFCPNDSSLDLETFEAAWTQGGVANAMANETTDRIQGSRSQKTSTSAAGTATWTKTITAVDISSGYTHVRLWHKIAAGEGLKITSLKLRIGNDASNYIEYSFPNVGSSFEDCWNYDSVALNDYDSVIGVPDASVIDWLQIVLVCNAAISANSIFFDHMLVSTGSFTLVNTTRGDLKINDLRIQYKRASEITEQIAKEASLFWYIDNERDLNLFTATTTPAPFSLTDSSENYRDLSVEVDISKLKNRQIVRGGEAPSEELYTQYAVADGSQTSFALDYKPKDLTMTIDAIPQDIGVEGFVDETTVDWVWNFEEKVIRKTDAGSTPTAGQEVVFTYYPYQPIRVSVTSPSSIAMMQSLTGGDGIYDGALINDQSISSFEDARMRARAELTQWANAITTAMFETDIDGLRAGQVITITDSSRSISAVDFLIQSVSWTQQYRDRWVYDVKASSTLFGIIEFIQMLLKRATSLTVSPSELVDTILNVDEEMTLTDSVTPTAKSKTVYAALKKTHVFDFVGLSGSKSANGGIDTGKQWYAEFSGGEAGTIQFTTSRHNNNAELRIQAVTGGNGLQAQARTVYRIAAVPSTSYTVDAWIEILTAFSNVGTNGGLKLVIKEWANQTGGSALATNTIFQGKTTVQDFNKVSGSFTSNASTAWISIEVSVSAAAGTGRMTDITIIPATTETATLPGIASFSQAT